MSVASDGTQANRQSDKFPSISADGKRTAFSSLAYNLVSNDNNSQWDVFVHDIDDSGNTDRRPVILVHGWQGIPGNDTFSCTQGIGRYGTPNGTTNTEMAQMAQWFVDADFDVWIAHYDGGPFYTPPIEYGAQCLRAQIANVAAQTGQNVIVVAHSLGGLVTRACLSLIDCRSHVSALYTLGSPHAGINSLFMLKFLALYKAPVVNGFVCSWQPTACQLLTDNMVWFNLANPNLTTVNYQFVGGSKTPFPSGWLLMPLDGVNDGLVGSHSAVGRLYPTNLNVVPGAVAGRYWTNESHTDALGYPSYFEPSGGSQSQAFRCMMWLIGKLSDADCLSVTNLSLNGVQTEPMLSANTVNLTGHVANGQTVSQTLQVDTDSHSLFYLSWLTSTLSLTITRPDGQIITQTTSISIRAS